MECRLRALVARFAGSLLSSFVVMIRRVACVALVSLACVVACIQSESRPLESIEKTFPRFEFVRIRAILKLLVKHIFTCTLNNVLLIRYIIILLRTI